MPAHKRGSSVLRSVAAAVAQQKAAPKQTSAQHQPASGGVQKRKQQQTPSPKQKQQKQQHKQQRKQAGQGAGRAHGQAGPGPSSTRHAGGHPCINVIHRQAAFAVQRLLTADETRSKGASLKSLTLAPHIQHKRATYAVTCQVLQYLPVLKRVQEQASLEDLLQEVSAFTFYVLAYELLFGQGLGGHRRRGPAEKAVLKVKDVKQLLGAQHQAPKHPRWARVNTIKRSVADVKAMLEKQGFEVQVDDLLPDLLRLPHGTDLHDHPLVAEGSLILQSKSSCMPAHALNPSKGWLVMDCCAAPGNKTTHVAALLHARGGGRVVAYDKDPKRLQRLKDNASRAGAERIITAHLSDFLAVDPSGAQAAQVKGIILDPSCSGSGTVFTRMDHLLPSYKQPAAGAAVAGVNGKGRGQQQGSGKGEEEAEEEEVEEVVEEEEGQQGGFEAVEEVEEGQGEEQEEELAAHGVEGVEDEAGMRRVEQLAKFQESALLHALSFPNVQRLVYSTCSVHERENERVVQAVLEAAAERGFELADPFPAWRRRGLPLFEGCQKLVRTDAFEDDTDGFFVAVFQRASSARPAAEDVQQPVRKKARKAADK